MNIKICVHNPVEYAVLGNMLNVTPTAIFLKSFYDIHGMNPDINWLVPEIFITENLDVTVENLLSENIDVLGLSIYVWNEKFQFTLAKKIKALRPNILIVMGGPQLAVHRTDVNDDDQDNFFINHPYVDYVVYGDGERPFQQILDYKSGYLQNKDTFVNIIERDNNGKRIIYPLEILSDEQYFSTSVFYSNRKMVEDTLQHIISKNLPKNNLIWCLEFARGCMYNCTFCDWSQNLTKKVKRRKNNWREDIDLFIELDQKIKETDANFGMWKDDIEIFDYCISKYDPNKNFQFIVSNTPKLRKEITEHIFLTSFKTYKEDWFNLKFSLQDTNDEVLSAIDRPSVPWSRIEQMVAKFENELPIKNFKNIGVELIIGLPGQTLDLMIENLIRLYFLKITNIIMYDWYHLSNSPASDPFYQKLWGLDIKTFYRSNSGTKKLTTESFEDLDKFYYDVGNSNKYLHEVSEYKSFYRTKHMNEIEMLSAKMLVPMFHKFLGLTKSENIENIKYTEKQIRQYLNRIKQILLKRSEDAFSYHKPLVEKYGYYIPMIKNNEKFETI